MSTQKIAVIGSGISGLGSAFILSEKHKVYLFEKDKKFGGHSNTITINKEEQKFKVDTGFIVYNDNNYPNFSKLLSHLKIRSNWSDMSLGFSFNDRNFEYACDNLDKLFAQRKNFLNYKYIHCLLQLLRFNKEAPTQLRRGHLDGINLKEFLLKFNYSKFFTDHLILPMAGAIWSTSLNNILDFPADRFVSFFINHDLMSGLKPSRKWRTIENGSEQYVKKIISNKHIKSKLNSQVVKVDRGNKKCILHFADGQKKEFDHVVFAISPTIIKTILSNKTSTEIKILSKFKISRNKAVLHSDIKLMPKLKKVWSSWNFVHCGSSDLREDPPGVIYWMNRLQNISKKYPFFVSLNPNDNIDEKKIYYETNYYHPQFNIETVEAQKEIEKIQGENGIWYAGAWLGNGFHEDGFSSAINISNKFNSLPKWLR